MDVNKPDPHQQKADELGITRGAAKFINYFELYGTTPTTTPLLRDQSCAEDILLCYDIVALWWKSWGAAKSARWEVLTGGAAFEEAAGIDVLQRLLPSHTCLSNRHPVTDSIFARDRLILAKGIAHNAEDESCFSKVEELLRPLAYLLRREQQ